MAQLTQEFFEEQLQKLATKQDLENLATKSDLTEQTDAIGRMINNAFDESLKGLATKQDLEALATKTDITDLRLELSQVREELQKISKRDIDDSNALAKDILKLQHRVDDLEELVSPPRH